MKQRDRVPVQFDKPPVIEVACGVTFALSKPMKSGHVGLYWAAVADEFPRCDDAVPLSAVTEGPGGADVTDYNVQLQVLGLPPLRRTWLINETGTHLLQLQDDRFIFNWKRTDPQPTYPRYANVIVGFRKHWAKYKAFLGEQDLGEPLVQQLELTYFNMLIGPCNFLRDHVRAGGDRYLPEAEAVNWRTQFVLPEESGRLHIAAASARHVTTREKGIRLDITARGLPKDVTKTGCEAWFDMAHEWITQGFADVTTTEAHELWGRTA